MKKTSSDANESDMQSPHRWKALALLALAQFLIILDTSIIGVALPTIQDHFGFSQSDLQWIFNAYVIVFGALLLLGGRLTDILGQKKIFIIGFMILTASSIAAGLASSGSVLIAARAFQGLGAAFVAPSALAIVMTLFGNNKIEMNKAMGIWGAAAPAGGTAGVFLGGIITAWVDWTWVFLINVPIGIAVLALAPKLLPKGEIQKGRVDYAGAITVTGALILLVYAIVTANEIGWTALQTLATLSTAGVLFFGFLYMQKKSKEPLLPLNIFKIRNLLASNVVMGLLGAAWIPMWFFLNLYLQQVLGYGAFESGLALLPMTVAIMFLMVSITPKMVNRFGVRKNMIVGMALLSLGMISFIMTPPSDANQSSNFFIYVLPASLIAAIGMSLAYVPVLTVALSNIQPKQAGLGSGLVNTSYQIGSALGLAIMVAWASAHSEALINSGVPQIIAMNNGFHFAFIGSAIMSAIATALIFVLNQKQEAKGDYKMRQMSQQETNFVIIFIAASIVSLLLGGYNSALAQNMTNMTIMTNMTSMSSKTMDSHEKHVLDKLIISQYIPLEGQLTDADYLLLMDLTPFATSVEGHNHIAVKIPCSQQGIPELTIFTGVAPNLKSLDLGIPISSGMLNGKNLDLSVEGKSCLYHADLPIGITDIGLINTSNRTINFDTGGYSVTISIHGTAAQHLGGNETEK